MIEPLRMNGRKVSVATMALGSRCRNMMVALETPSARAALTYSKLRARRNSARTTPTSDAHEKSSRMPSSTKKLGAQHRGDDEQQVERRDRRPDLDEALEDEVDPAAEIALHRAGRARRSTDETMARIRPNSTEMRKP